MAPYYDFFRKTKFYMRNDTKLLNYGVMIKGATELLNLKILV